MVAPAVARSVAAPGLAWFWRRCDTADARGRTHAWRPCRAGPTPPGQTARRERASAVSRRLIRWFDLILPR